MQHTSDTTARDSRSPPQAGGVTTRAQTVLENNTAQPALTSGFGAVIEKERALQDVTEGAFGRVNGEHAGTIDSLLRLQDSRLRANIALLEQRYEALPHPERFASWHERTHPPEIPRRAAQRERTELLPDLIARHAGLLADLETLIDSAPDGQRGELILAEVSRNHEEMAWMLTALLREDETAARLAADRAGPASGDVRRAQENWDNEGGLVSSNPPAS